MSLLAVPIISVIALILTVFIAGIYWWKITVLTKKIVMLDNQDQMNELLINELKTALDSSNTRQQTLLEELTETVKNSQKTLTVSEKNQDNKIMMLQGGLEQLEERLQHYTEQQPEDKLYTRAFKMANLGAGIDEIMTECELPRAEVEMLLSLYQANIDQS